MSTPLSSRACERGRDGVGWHACAWAPRADLGGEAACDGRGAGSGAVWRAGRGGGRSEENVGQGKAEGGDDEVGELACEAVAESRRRSGELERTVTVGDDGASAGDG